MLKDRLKEAITSLIGARSLKSRIGRFAALALIAAILISGSSFAAEAAKEKSQGSIDLDLGTQGRQEGPTQDLYYRAYTVVAGDTLSDIADKFETSLDALVSFNGIKSAKSLKLGSVLRIPNMPGILYTTQAKDSIESLAKRYNVSQARLIEVNKLGSKTFAAHQIVFLPDAKLPATELREISGDLFRWPLRGWITSYYGWRRDPFSNQKAFHNGIDISANIGSSVRAAMTGVVKNAGYSNSAGNYIILSHSGRWESLYAHLSKIKVKVGDSIQLGQEIGSSGNSGYSTGPHLHFSILKRGRLVNPFTFIH